MLTRIAGAIEHIIDLCGRAVSWLTLLMVIVTFCVVVLRYVFDTGWIWLQESITYFHACVFMIGAAWTLQQNAHVRVDILHNRLSETARAWIELFGTACLLLPFMLFVSWVSWDYVLDSWAVLEGSREAGGLPGVFLLKTLIPVMAALLCLQALAQALRALVLIRQGRA